MTSFAENLISYPDGQVNVVPLPEAIMRNGFIPETRDAPGMPLPAQYLNWLFRDLYRQVQQTSGTYLDKSANLADLEDKQQAIKNLGLSNMLLPAWAPIACPFENPPLGWLKCNGAAFDMERFPELAKGYPSGFLPDLRGEFIRGWDDGRGVDVDRGILTAQLDAMEKLYGRIHMFKGIEGLSTDGVFSNDMVNVSTGGHVNAAYVSNGNIIFDSSSIARTAEETRPRNIAFLYIVRAA